MYYVMGETVIARPVDEVFAFLADKGGELPDDPGLLRWKTVTTVQPPKLITGTTVSWHATACGTLRLEQVAGGTRVRWCWNLRPTGPWRLLGSLLARRRQRRGQQTWTRIKAYLETSPSGVAIRDADLRSASAPQGVLAR